MAFGGPQETWIGRNILKERLNNFPGVLFLPIPFLDGSFPLGKGPVAVIPDGNGASRPGPKGQK